MGCTLKQQICTVQEKPVSASGVQNLLAQSVLLNQLPLVGAAATIPDLQDT
jgi:hypothetical protein